MTWARGTRSPQPLHLRSKGGLALASISYGTAIMRRFQLDWSASFEIGSAATEGGFLPVLISHGSTQMHRLRYATGEPRHEAAPTLPTSGGGGVGGLHRTQFEKQKEKFSKTLKTSVSFGLFWSLLLQQFGALEQLLSC